MMIRLRKIRRLTLACLLSSILLLCVGLPAFADTANPTSVSVDDIVILRDLIQPHDVLFLARYNIAYTSVPSTTVDNTFIFRLIDTDNVTEIGAYLAYPFSNSGYGQGVACFYFDNVTAPTWGQPYSIRIDGNPSVFTTPPTYSFAIPPSDYTSFDTQSQNRVLLYNFGIMQAQFLTTAWGLTATPLYDNTGGNTVLSDLGEAYFRNAIPGLQSLCPQLFYLQQTAFAYTHRTWDYSFTTTLLTTFNGTPFIWNAMTGFSGLWGFGTTDPSVAMGFVTLLLVVVVIGLSASPPPWGANNVQAGFVDGAAVLIYCTLSGWFSPILHAIIAFFCVFMGAMIWFLNRG